MQFIIIDQFENATNLKYILCQRLIKRECFLDQNTVKFTPKNDKKVLALNKKTVAQAFNIHISPTLSHR